MSDDIFEAILKAENEYPGWSKHVATNFIIKELKSRNIPAKKLGKIACSYVEGIPLYYNQAFSSCFNGAASKAISNKETTKELLRCVGVNTAKGMVFNNKGINAARDFALSLPSAVLKPLSGARGNGVSVGIKTIKQFDSAWDNIISIGAKKILVEEEFFGEEARYLVVGGKCLSVTKRVPPFVIGDGVNTVSQLLQDKNSSRSTNPSLKSKLIRLNPHRVSILDEQGFSVNSIPSKGVKVFIDYMSSISLGGETIEITEYVHPALKKAAENAGSIFEDMDVIGVDLMARNHFDEVVSNDYIVIEVNAQPGLGSHQCPAFGKPKWVIPDVVDAALDSLRLASKARLTLEKTMHVYAASGVDFNVNENSRSQYFELATNIDGGDGSLRNDSIASLASKAKRSTPSLLKRALSNQLFFRDFLRQNGLPMVKGKAFGLSDIDKIKEYISELKSYSVFPFNSSTRMNSSMRDGDLDFENIIQSEKNIKKAVAKGLYVDNCEEFLAKISLASAYGFISGFSFEPFDSSFKEKVFSRVNKLEIIDMANFITQKLPMVDTFSISFIILNDGSFFPDKLDFSPDMSSFTPGFLSFQEFCDKAFDVKFSVNK